MILYSVAAEVSLGRLFLAGIGPGPMLVALFAGYAVWRFRKEYRAADPTFCAGGLQAPYPTEKTPTLRHKIEILPRVMPFVVPLICLLGAPSCRPATPSDSALPPPVAS